MLQPSTTLASIVRQAGLEDLADAITIDQSACIAELHTQARCDELAAASERQQMLADVAAIGFALFVAALVGRIAGDLRQHGRTVTGPPSHQDAANITVATCRKEPVPINHFS